MPEMGEGCGAIFKSRAKERLTKVTCKLRPEGREGAKAFYIKGRGSTKALS